MSFIINCANIEKIEVNINNENVQKSKLLIEFYEEYKEGSELDIPFDVELIKLFIRNDFNFDIEFEIIYNFFNYLKVDECIIIFYISFKYNTKNLKDTNFLKKLLEQKEGIIKCAENNDLIGVLIGFKLGHINMQDNGGMTASHRASYKGHIEIVKVLLESGADVNKQNKEGCTALHKASSDDHIEIVKVLLESGADINIQDKWGNTALHIASGYGYVEIVKVLLKYGANVNVKDKNGWTALHNASTNNRTEIIKLLVKSGADVNAKNKYGWIALRMGHTDIVKLLEN